MLIKLRLALIVLIALSQVVSVSILRECCNSSVVVVAVVAAAAVAYVVADAAAAAHAVVNTS